MEERKSAAGMIGEFLREIGVLFLVFGMLDPVVYSNKQGVVDRLSSVEATWAVFVLAVSVLLFVGGVAIELHRRG